MSYTHLTATEQFNLHHLLTSTTLSLRAIAKELNRDASTISRELRRNRAQQNTYLPDTAQTKSEQRRQAVKPALAAVDEDCIAEIKAGLESYHSPEQISGRMKRTGKKTLSHETIYKLIYNDYFGIKRYREHLRQGKRKRKRRASSKSGRESIPGRVGIE